MTVRLPLSVRLPAIGVPAVPAAVRHRLPLLAGVLVALFLLAQARLGRRDPRLSKARRHPDDDSVTFR